jgi:hypothetical protein
MRRVAVVFALALGIPVAPGAGLAQWYTPQSDRDLRVTWIVETTGTSGAQIVGKVQNLSRLPASRVVLRADGLNEAGRVVSRARTAVQVPAQGSSPFEIRLQLAGMEQQYRVTVESFEFGEPRRGRSESPQS